MHLGGRPAGVEGPSYRRGSEAVDRRTAAGLHVRDQRQLARELLLERAGRDRGQVGLQQDVVDRSGEQVVERLRPGPRPSTSARPNDETPSSPVIPSSAASVSVGATWARRMADRRGRRQRIRSTSDEMPVPAASALSSWQVGQLGEYVGAQLDQPAPGEVGGEGVHRLVADPSADRRDQARVREPGPREGGPALGDRAGLPGVEGVGRQPGGVGVVGHALVEQAGRRGGLDHQRGDVDLDVQQGRGCAQVSYGEAAGLQRSRRVGAPPVQEQLGAPYELEGGAGRGPVDERLRRARRWPAPVARRAAGRRTTRSPRRTDHGIVTCRSSMRSSRPEATRSAVGPAPPLHRPFGTGLVEVVEDGPRRSGQLVEQAWPPRRPAGPRGRRNRSPTTSTGRRGEPQTRASDSSRSIARSTAAGVAGRSAGSVPCTSACSTVSSRASSASRARSTEVFTTTRAASCEESCGAGAARSGRASSSADSCSSGQLAELVGEGARGGRGHPAILRGGIPVVEEGEDELSRPRTCAVS